MRLSSALPVRHIIIIIINHYKSELSNHEPQVPEQHRAGQAKSKPAGPAARKAWQALMNHEVTKLRLDLLQHLAALMEKM